LHRFGQEGPPVLDIEAAPIGQARR